MGTSFRNTQKGNVTRQSKSHGEGMITSILVYISNFSTLMGFICGLLILHFLKKDRETLFYTFLLFTLGFVAVLLIDMCLETNLLNSQQADLLRRISARLPMSIGMWAFCLSMVSKRARKEDIKDMSLLTSTVLPKLLHAAPIVWANKKYATGEGPVMESHIIDILSLTTKNFEEVVYETTIKDAEYKGLIFCSFINFEEMNVTDPFTMTRRITYSAKLAEPEGQAEKWSL